MYGRRKTGKTWLLRRCIDWDVYATVTSTGECIVDSVKGSRILGLEECMNEVVGLLRKGDTVVLDEFQRLPQCYWDYLATAH